MYTVRIKRMGRPLYRALLGLSSAEQQKASIREQVMRLPVNPAYPFDVEAKLLRSVGVKPAVLDVGAYSGLYSTVLEDIVGPSSLFLFEPLPDRHTVLRAAFPRAHVFELALSNETALRHLRVPSIDGRRADWRASFSGPHDAELPIAEEILVRSVSLDSIITTLPLTTIGLIKIDVEGHERAVLEGAQSTIRRYRPLLLIRLDARRHSVPLSDAFASIETLGYRGFFVDSQGYALRPVAALDVTREQGKFFFVPYADVRDFTMRAEAFLDGERRQRRTAAVS